MQYYIDILSFMAITLLLLLAGILLKRGNHRQHFLPCTFFCLSVACYLLVKWDHLPAGLYYLLHLPVFAVSFFFWIFSRSVFNDNFKLEKWMGWTLFAVVSVLYGNFFIREQLDIDSTIYKISILVHHIPTIIFTYLAIFEASQNKDADLLVDRLQFRNIFIFLTGVIITMVVFIEIAFVYEPPMVINLLQKLAIVILAFYFALKELSLKSGFFNESELATVSSATNEPEIDKTLVNELLQVVEDQHYYRTEGLTISGLASKLKVKEYKLRQAINQQLGFRNFNDFLNSYRIQEACEQLIDPKKKKFTVLEIAFELGYNSLAPFNKAFKNNTGMTPTEYKKLNGGK